MNGGCGSASQPLERCENDNLSGILNYLKEGDRVRIGQLRPCTCPGSASLPHGPLDPTWEMLLKAKSPPKLKTNSTIPSPPQLGASHQMGPVLLLWGQVCPLLPPPLPQLRPGLWHGHPAALPWVSASPPGTSTPLPE